MIWIVSAMCIVTVFMIVVVLVAEESGRRR